MIPFGAITAIVAIAVILAFVVARVEDLAFLAPRKTSGLATSARGFCSGSCRYPDGRCPLSGSYHASEACPLWKYVDDNVPMVAYGSPFGR